MEWKQLEEFPLYEMCKETKEIRHIASGNTKRPHGTTGAIRLYKNGNEYSRKIDKLHFSTFPETIGGVELPNLSRYRILQEGLVYSVYEAKMLKPSTDRSGYQSVDLVTDNGIHEESLVHRLVAKAYLPTDGIRSYVNHIDGNKQNNHISNLEWCTPSENLTHAVSTGLYSSKMRRCKLSLDGCNWLEFDSIEEAASYLQVGPSQVRSALVKNLTKEFNRGTPTTEKPFRVKKHIALYIDSPVRYNINK